MQSSMGLFQKGPIVSLKTYQKCGIRKVMTLGDNTPAPGRAAIGPDDCVI